MKKAFSIIGLIIVLVIPLFGCSESGPAATPDPVVTRSVLDTQISNFRVEMQTMVNNSIKPQAVDLSPYATKTSVEVQISDAIAKLKSDQSWITTVKTTIKPTTHEPTDEDVLDSTSDLVLSLEKAVEEDFYLGSGELSPYMKLSITNNDSSSHTYRLKADFDCDDTLTVTAVELTADYSYSSSSGMYPDVTLPTTTSTIGFTSRRNITSAPISTDTTWYIGKNRTESIYLRFKPTFSDAGSHTWTWSYTLKQVD
jgi:hypothetical protein